jgi:hypothetical protein
MHARLFVSFGATCGVNFTTVAIKTLGSERMKRC